MTTNEFSPYKYFTHLLSLWWMVALITLIGGALGFAFFHLHPAEYEATATYLVSIDLNHFPFQGVREDLIQYNEDMAVNTTQDALLSNPVLSDVLDQLKTQGISLTIADLLQNYTIERKLEVWELRVRSHVPRDAQTIVNTWAQIGYQAMVSWQSTGKAPAYVVFQPPSLAVIPTRPVLYGRSNLMLGGAVIGLVLGIVIAPLFKWGKPQSTQHD